MDLYSVCLAVFFGLVIFGIFKGYGPNRTIIVFRDYDDLGLTFLIPVSFVLIAYLFTHLGGNPKMGFGIAGVVAAWLFFRLARGTFIDNGRSILKTMLALITKLPLGIIWVMNLVQLLNPGGKGAGARAKSRGQALLVLTFLTPIIGLLVVDKSGSFFNPKAWIKGRRVGGSIRNNL